MSKFVLVHGSFHGGWVWKDVAATLRNAGHTVHTPTLTGIGDRSHLISPNIGISVNVTDIVNYLEYNDLQDVILVGHSYGGLVISGVAEACADRLKRLVYFDGFIPEDGQSAWDIAPAAQERWENRASQTSPAWLVPPPDPTVKYGEHTDRVEWHREQLTPMAMWTHEERLQLPDNKAATLPRSYIECTQYEIFQHMAEKARTEGFDFYSLDTHHNPIVYQPELVSDTLLSIANTA